MDILYSAKPLYAIGVSLAAVLLIALSGEKRPNLREFWTIAAAVVKFAIVVSMIPLILDGAVLELHLLTILPGLEIAFRVDALGLVFATTASFLWIITSFYSIGYMRTLGEHGQTRYYMSFALAMAAVMGAAFAANMFTLFFFYEVITLSTFPLVAHNETAVAINGARKYLIYLLGSSLAFLLFAIFLTYNAAGTLDFANGGILDGKGSDLMLIVIFILFMAGTTKAALMPLHGWLPAAMVAPTPVSAFLHAVAVVKVGVFTVVRIVLFIFGTGLLDRLDLGTALAYFASFTIIAASIMAIRQDNLKARLAYSTVSQLSYIVLGVALLVPDGITGSIMHITIHAFGKITLFFVAGAIYVAHHKTKVSELNGIGRRMPFTMGAFTIGALLMIGLPPTAGFISKWYLLFGSVRAEQLPIMAVLVVSTILNGCYFLPIVYAAFFKEPDPGEETGRAEAPAFMVVPLVVTALGTIALFFWPTLFLELAGLVVAGASG